MDLNSAVYGDKDVVKKETLMQHVTDLDIYNMYMDGKPVSLSGTILSPIRPEKRASFGFFVGDDNEILFKDFRLGGGDCIKFVQLKYNLNYNDALNKIAKDFKLDDYFILPSIVSSQERKIVQDRIQILDNHVKFILRKRKRNWNIYDIKFWKSFGITEKTLKQYRVEPIDYFFINEHIIKAERYAYSFTETKDGYETYKIYQPFSEKYKWINSHSEDVWQGWTQLPEKGTHVIVTKSLKDVMAITENFNIPAVSLQAESVKPKKVVIDELKKRFFHVLLFYDNDYDKDTNWGQKYAKQLSEEFELDNIYIPSRYKAKDYSDLVKKYGVDVSNNILQKEIDKISRQIPF